MKLLTHNQLHSTTIFISRGPETNERTETPTEVTAKCRGDMHTLETDIVDTAETEQPGRLGTLFRGYLNHMTLGYAFKDFGNADEIRTSVADSATTAAKSTAHMATVGVAFPDSGPLDEIATAASGAAVSGIRGAAHIATAGRAFPDSGPLDEVRNNVNDKLDLPTWDKPEGNSGNENQLPTTTEV